MEEWREIPGTEYEVSSEGRVASRKRVRRKMLKPLLRGFGYFSARLYVDAEAHFFLIHRLVAEAFLGPRPTPRHEVNHIDGIRANNHVGNLEWVTRSENLRHRYRVLKHGAPRGEASGVSKVTEVEVREIRTRRAAGERRKSVAADYRISTSNVDAIFSGKTWGWLT